MAVKLNIPRRLRVEAFDGGAQILSGSDKAFHGQEPAFIPGYFLSAANQPQRPQAERAQACAAGLQSAEHGFFIAFAELGFNWSAGKGPCAAQSGRQNVFSMA